jgi:dTDP-4-dehydrorhamnose reductase
MRLKKIFNKNILILGSRGMLGNQVYKYFKNNKYKVSKLNKRIEIYNANNIIKKLNLREKSIIINCIGKIKQKEKNFKKLFFINSIFPYKLSYLLNKKHLLIHPSTDCVFNGNKKSYYKLNSDKDSNDIYGISKSIAELALERRKNTLIIRTSIIGISKSKKDLLSWFLSQKKKIFGYTNHFWNGVTTLEWCKKVEYLIANSKNLTNKSLIIQLGTKKTYSKYDMLNIFKKIFEKKIKILKKKKNYTNRTLKPTLLSNDLTTQLIDFRNNQINNLKLYE